jgi:hypothetical protein
LPADVRSSNLGTSTLRARREESQPIGTDIFVDRM